MSSEIIPKEFINKPADYPKDLSYAQIRETISDLMGEFETPEVALDIKILDETLLEGDIVRQTLEYSVAKGERVRAFHLFKTDLADDAPGLLSIHGHGGEDIFPVGKAFHCNSDPNDPNQYSYIAALNGFRVLAPDALCFGERKATWGYSSNFFDEINTHMELTAKGKSLAWKALWDNSRAVEVLENLGVKKIGSIGWSGGSTQGYMLAALNEKVMASVCFFSFVTLRHQFYQYRCCHCLYHFLPNMIKAGIDWDQVVALVAPRKIFLGWGALDAGTPEDMYRAFVDAIEARCKKENLPKSVFTFEEKDHAHEITPKMLSAAIDFLKENL